MNTKFVHLHVHTEYSLLDGLSQIKKLIRHVKANSMEAIAITDHGAMYGVVDFYKVANQEGVKPIIGMEGYSTNIPLEDVENRARSRNYHVLYLAKDKTGYKNLMNLCSRAHLDGYYYRPRADRETIKKYSQGLICTSACPLGEIPQALIEGNYEKAKKDTQWFLDTFGEDFYLEVQRHEYDTFAKSTTDRDIKSEVEKMASNEKVVNEGIIKLSREMGVPLVATNDTHYTSKEDAMAQDALMCIATGKVVSETKRLRLIDTPSFYVRSPEEMSELFKDIPEALENTLKIADKCNLEIELGKWYFPKFNLPDDLSADECLEKLAHERLHEKIETVTKEVKERLNYELEIIIKKGYAPYFLIVEDIVNWANEKGIVTNTRGSAAGSLVSYVLGITTVNPLTYYLPFERFLNPYRPSPPDIDFDVSDDRREDIITYISGKYGKEKVAQICTFGRMLSRGAVRDVARVLGYPYAIGDRISKLIPPPKQGFPITIPRALEEVAELKRFYDEDKDTKKILDLAHEIEGNARHLSVHAAGLVVAPTKITDFSPVQREPSGEKIITQYEFHTCESVGLIKFDILGIRNLSILGESIKIVKDLHNIDIDLHKIPLDDKKTFEMLGHGDTMGTFQLSSGGMTKYLKDLKPTRIEDLMAMVALYRPGPIAIIPEYIKRKRDPKLVKYLDPRMEKFLGASYGLIVYQDDLLFCAIDLAGYTWEEADKFRKAVGKKIPEEMAAQKEKFINGIVANGQTKKFADDLWLLFEPFQSYGFNKAHAASYGMVAYQTSYMKANYPVEFMCALLTAESDDKDKISAAINECRRMKIKVLSPDINESHEDFVIVTNKDSLNKQAIRFGLNAIKNVGNAAVGAILEARKEGDFVSFADFLSRVDARKANKKVLESLIKVGALSSFGTRSALLTNMDRVREKVVVKAKGEKQQGLFGEEEIKKSSGASFSDLSGLQDVGEFADEELQELEKEFLGFSLSAKPISEVLSSLIQNATHSVSEVLEDQLVIGSEITLVGVVKEVREIITRKTGQEMAFVKIEDPSGVIDLVVFPKIFQEAKIYLLDGKPVVVKGKLDRRDDSFSVIANFISNEKLEDTKGRLFIRIPKGVTKEQLGKLREFLLANPGENPVTLVFESNRERINLARSISWDKDIAKSISDILSPDLASS